MYPFVPILSILGILGFVIWASVMLLVIDQLPKIPKTGDRLTDAPAPKDCVDA